MAATAGFLGLLSPLYRLVVQTRLKLYETGVLRSETLPHPVISVGNLTTGGTGKTPLVMYLAQILKQAGLQPAILTRGYKGRAEQTAALASDGSRNLASAEESGDEACLMATRLEGVPIAVGKARDQSARLIPGFGANRKLVFILDDAYQHLQIVRNLNILVLDATDPFGGGRLLPAGRLREPLSAIKRADLVIVTRAHLPFDQELLETEIRRRNRLAKISYFYHDAVGLVELGTGASYPVRHLLHARVVAVSAIGNPAVFLQDLAHYQIDVAESITFRDHHVFSSEDLKKIYSRARSLDVRAVVTTEKDTVRLHGSTGHDTPVYALRIEAKPEDPEKFERDLIEEVRGWLSKGTQGT
ncbi:MAG: tetraacyldisaccharide 4'-kinase [Acidobacteria bacterium]|nr:MAG: tetraacyldisaccharide 4'-kinase [Acidobacteriota bacterium]